MSILSKLIEEAVEAAYREGWNTGYNAGRLDGQSDGTQWCDIERDWSDSETRDRLVTEKSA